MYRIFLSLNTESLKSKGIVRNEISGSMATQDMLNHTTKLSMSNSTTIRHAKPTKANFATKSGEDGGFPRRNPAVNPQINSEGACVRLRTNRF